MAVHHHHLPMSDYLAAHQEFHGVQYPLIQLHHGAGVEFEDLA